MRVSDCSHGSSNCSQEAVSTHTIGGTLGHWALAATTANTHAVDNIALLGLVTQTASLVGARRARGTVDDVQLSELYFALSAKFNECIAGASCDVHDRDDRTPISLCVRQSRFEVMGIDRRRFSRVVFSYLPASHTEKEPQDIRLLLLLKLFDVFEGTHLRGR